MTAPHFEELVKFDERLFELILFALKVEAALAECLHADVELLLLCREHFLRLDHFAALLQQPCCGSQVAIVALRHIPVCK